ncbi:hypothetical protein [Loktanella sp. SALINAS62]|uniref:hypothetical protein n=1 Tax=Loktanella sp. SALINAS62 TaxID=2706124 RepID=UPI001B8CE4C6|nr:hypothetical protein [Loktanella sp. SALINAS62]MBS1303898.1 hypothetical protein [Loktanella sp. SALINAS62]
MTDRQGRRVANPLGHEEIAKARTRRMNRRHAIGAIAATSMSATATFAQTVDLSALNYINIAASDYGFLFSIPEGADILFGDDGPPAVPQGLVYLQEHTMTVVWEGRTVFIDRMPLEYDFYHIDFLHANAELANLNALDLQMLENDQGLIIGRQIVADRQSPGQRLVSYFVLIDANGYYIHVPDQRSNILADIIADSFTYTGDGAAWGELSDTKTISYKDLTFEVKDDFGITEITQADTVGDPTRTSPRLIVHNAFDMPSSSFAFEAIDTSNVDDPISAFLEEIAAIGFIAEITDRTNTSLEARLLAPDNTNYFAYFYKASDDLSISLITQTFREKTAIWLAGRKVYTDAALMLDGN